MGPASKVIPVNKGHRNTGFASTTGATGAVQVGLLVFGHGVVDHVADIVDVDAAGGDLRCNQNVFLTAAESVHRFLASLLRHVTVQRSGAEPAVNKFFRKLSGLALGAHENDGALSALGLQNAADNLVFVHLVCAVNHLLDVSLGLALVGVRDPDVNGSVLILTRQRQNCRGHGR